MKDRDKQEVLIKLFGIDDYKFKSCYCTKCNTILILKKKYISGLLSRLDKSKLCKCDGDYNWYYFIGKTGVHDFTPKRIGKIFFYFDPEVKHLFEEDTHG